jgi:fructokinase
VVDGEPHTEDAFGGAPGNTAAGLARLAVRVSIAAHVGDDKEGRFLEATLRESGVDTSRVTFDPDYPTTMAFVTIEPNGDRDFQFKLGAHDKIRPENVELPAGAQIFHFGSLLQISPDAAAATDKLIQQARETGAAVSYDPNYREPLWGDAARARQVILETAAKVDIMKVSDAEAQLLTGIDASLNPEQAAEALFLPTMDALFISLGARGVYYKTKAHEGIVAVPVHVVVKDTTGAGDAFNAGILYERVRSGKPFSECTQQEIETALSMANRIAALTTREFGATTSFPTRTELGIN